MSLRMTKAAAQKYLQKQKPNTFITLRREQFEELENNLRIMAILDFEQSMECKLCGVGWPITAEGGHYDNCPVYLISKLEKV